MESYWGCQVHDRGSPNLNVMIYDLRRAAVCSYEYRGQSLPVDDKGAPLHGVLRYDTDSNVAPFSVPRAHKVSVIFRLTGWLAWPLKADGETPDLSVPCNCILRHSL